MVIMPIDLRMKMLIGSAILRLYCLHSSQLLTRGPGPQESPGWPGLIPLPALLPLTADLPNFLIDADRARDEWLLQ